LFLIAAMPSLSEAQRYRRSRSGSDTNGGNNQPGGQTDPNANKPKLPEDARLLEIHQAFIRGAEKLALEYVRKKEPDKAIACYREILRLVPNYPAAQAALAKIIGKQATAKRVVIDVLASKGWQDSGVDLIEGKPVMIRADGHWKINMHYPVGGDGVEIPKELRQFNLGSLIGIIIPPGDSPSSKLEAPQESGAASDEKPAEQQAPAANGGENAGGEKPAATAVAGEAPKTEAAKEEEDKKPRPFFIGHQADLFAKSSGRLYLRMYDSEADDNVGKITVVLSGTFAPPK
jgi:hypothetical protein